MNNTIGNKVNRTPQVLLAILCIVLTGAALFVDSIILAWAIVGLLGLDALCHLGLISAFMLQLSRHPFALLSFFLTFADT